MQASYRSSAALMGIAIIQNIYGNAGMAPLMIIGTVPLYNVMAVVILSVLKPERGKVDKALLFKDRKGDCNKPDYTRYFSRYDLVGTAPSDAEILDKTVSNVGVLATPLGLMALGASFDLKQAAGKIKPAIVATFIKLIGLAAIFFLPIGVMLGYTHEHLIAFDRDARLCQHGELLCYGEKYGTRRHADIQRRCFDNIVFCVDDDWMAVYFRTMGLV